MADDEALQALDALVTVLEEHARRSAKLAAAATAIRAERERGVTYADILDRLLPDYVANVTTPHLSSVVHASADFRRALAAALHDEGMTMDAVAARLGVSRQRVSRMLREIRRP
jgi:transposase